MNCAQNEEQGSSVVHNGKPLKVPNHSPSLSPKFEDLSEEPDLQKASLDEPPVVQIEVGEANVFL